MKSKKIKKQELFVSTIIVAGARTSNLLKYVTELSDYLTKRYVNYEIIIIDNTAPISEISSVVEALSLLPCIRLIRLSRFYKQDTAIFAGLEAAIGDYVITLDSTLDSVQEVELLVEANKKSDAVQGVSNIEIKGFFGSNFGRRLFYWYNKRYLGIDISPSATYLMSLSRRAVNALTASNRHDRHVRHLLETIGYTPIKHSYTPLTDPGRQRSLRTGVVQALEITSGYSTHPLRFVTWLGFFAGIANIIYMIYVVITAFVKEDIAPGWITTSLQLSGMFFILFAVLVILSEYISRILDESRRDPRYLILDEQSSSVLLADIDRKNVTGI